MKNGIGYIMSLALAAIVFCDGAQATNERPAQEERISVEYRVNDDLSWVENHSRSSVSAWDPHLYPARWTLVVNSAGQQLEILDAHTVTRDGRVIPVPEKDISTSTDELSGLLTMEVMFAAAAQGDAIAITYQIRQQAPTFPEHFSAHGAYRSARYPVPVHVRIDLPAKLAVRYAAHNMTQSVVEERGRRVIDWDFAPGGAPAGRINPAYDATFDPGFEVSTFASYREIAEAYRKQSVGKAAVTPRIKALARMITAGKKGGRQETQAILEWVSRNIGEFTQGIGPGTVEPHAADIVLDRKSGDCKDHAILLQALLSARQIESVQVLMSPDGIYELPEIPTATMIRHVMLYVPRFDVYLDSATGEPFGEVAFSRAYTPVVGVERDMPGARTPSASFHFSM